MAQAVLFACTMNAVRSPMAAAMLRHLTRDIHIESAGVRAGELDPLAVEAMDEIGLAIAKHQPRRFEDVEDGGFDLVILDGEAAPFGGIGIAKQLKDEITDCPPILVLTGRADDAWLANWSRAEAAVPHPIDPIRLADAVVGLLRSSAE